MIMDKQKNQIIDMDIKINQLRKRVLTARQERRFELIRAKVASGWTDVPLIIRSACTLLEAIEALEAQENGG
jgi:hypothetical protein